MKNYTKLLSILLYTSLITYALTCFVYWVINPDLSQMQVFLKFWYWLLINLILVAWFTRHNLR